MKKILIITDNLAEQINGVVTTYKNIEACAVLDGYTIDYIHPGRFSYVDCPKYNEVKLAIPTKIGEEIEKISPDYIHIATEGPIGLWARAYLTKHNISFNTAYHTKFPEGLKKLVHIPETITWSYVRWFHNHNGKVLTTTESMVKDLKNHGFNGDIIPWTRGVDRSIFYPRNNKKNQQTVLVCVSRISKEKNLEDFFNLEFPNSHKIMVGDGPMLSEYKEKYPTVEFVGAKRGNELGEYFSMGDVFVFPSRWETFGLVMIEAMACGTPVAAYPCQGPIDVIDEGITGCMNENLTQAVYDAIMLDRNKVFEGSKRWSWENCWTIFKENLITY